jgi:putative hemolysin
MLILEIVVVLALFVLNGFFAMAELAIIASRRAGLERLAKEGRPGAQLALALANDPARMLTAVQVGFTTTAMLAGIFSGATLADRLEEALQFVPFLAAYGKPLSIVITTIGVTYTALVIGELAPKYLALNNPEPIAFRVARPLAFVARMAAPVIWLLNGSTRLLLRMLQIRPRFERALSEDDIHYLVAEGARLGVIHTVERDMIEGILDLEDSPVRTIMTPRPQVLWIDINGPKEQILSRVRSCPHAQLLACCGSIDDVRGIVRKQDLIDQVLDGQSPDVERVARPPLIVHESTAILRTLDLFRKTPVHTAIVVDEFGSLQGIVTRTDLLEKLAGDLPKIDTVAKPKVSQREDGSYLIDASVPFPDVMHVTGMSEAPSGDYVTLAGFILSQLHELPKPGDYVVWAGWRFEVIDMDGRRINSILARRAPGVDQAVSSAIKPVVPNGEGASN